MGIKFEAVTAGDTLYSVFRRKMGNTSIRQTVSLSCVVLEIDHENGSALISRNGNPARWMHRSHVEKLRRTPYKPKARRPSGEPHEQREGEGP